MGEFGHAEELVIRLGAILVPDETYLIAKLVVKVVLFVPDWIQVGVDHPCPDPSVERLLSTPNLHDTVRIAQAQHLRIPEASDSLDNCAHSLWLGRTSGDGH